MKYVIGLLLLISTSSLAACDNQKPDPIEQVKQDIKAYLMKETKTPSSDTLPGYQRHYENIFNGNSFKIDSFSHLIKQALENETLQKDLEKVAQQAIKEVAIEKFEQIKK